MLLLLSQGRADSLRPGLNEEMYRAARNVLLCLSESMESAVNPCDGGSDDQLRQLQQEVTSPFSFIFKHAFILFAIQSSLSVFSDRADDAVRAARRSRVGDGTRNMEGTWVLCEVSPGLSGRGPADLHPSLLSAQPAAGPSMSTSGGKHTSHT